MALDYLVAVPRMALYMEYSARVYQMYLQYVAPEDMHVYSIDEVFLGVTGYLRTYGLTARELAVRIIRTVQGTVGITAAAGIGTNLYLAKVAMDIGAKHVPPDENGVQIAELDEMSYRLFGINAELLIDHAWGWEPCTIADIKAYKPAARSVGAGQVLPCAYSFEKARLVAREKADRIALDLVDQGLLTDQLVLTVGYDRDNLRRPL